MAQVYLSIGSNIERKKHVIASLDALAENFGELMLSSIYESEAVGFDGENFYNLVVGIDTAMSVGELSLCLRKIEHKNGRLRSGVKFSPRTLDIDILTYNQVNGEVDGIVLPRYEVVHNAFVLQPLAEIAPTDIHPKLLISYADLWAGYDKSQQKLWTVDFIWRKKLISRCSDPRDHSLAQ